MSKATRKKVLKLADEWGYKPNPHALGLLHKRTYSIGLIVPELTHHFYSRIISGVDSILDVTGYQQFISTSKEAYEREKRAVDTFLNARVDGLLIAMTSGTTKYDHIQKILDREVPVVLLDRMCEDVMAPYVITDDFKGATTATEYLIMTGCRNIIFIKGPENISTAFSRYMGFQEALKNHGIPLKDHMVIGGSQPQDLGRKLAQLLQKEKVDAIFGHSDYHAFHAMKIVRELKFRVPQDISIMGYADEPVATYTTPAISTVRQPAHQMGKLGMELLLSEIETGKQSAPKILDTELVIRASTH
jgi:LacI family transcriptional regulator